MRNAIVKAEKISSGLASERVLVAKILIYNAQKQAYLTELPSQSLVRLQVARSFIYEPNNIKLPLI